MNRHAGWFAFILAGLCLIPRLEASDDHPFGVTSNILVDQSRVIFAQADGTLTALDLQSGRVLTRILRPIFDGTLVTTNAGIFSCGPEAIALLDPRTLSTVWEIGGNWDDGDVALHGNVAYVSDDRYNVTAIDVQTGHVLWTHANVGPGKSPSSTNILPTDSTQYELFFDPDGLTGGCRRPDDGHRLWSFTLPTGNDLTYSEWIDGRWAVFAIDHYKQIGLPNEFELTIRDVSDGHVAGHCLYGGPYARAIEHELVVWSDPPRIIVPTAPNYASAPGLPRFAVFDSAGIATKPIAGDELALFHQFRHSDNFGEGQGWSTTYYRTSRYKVCVDNLYQRNKPGAGNVYWYCGVIEVKSDTGQAWRALLPYVSATTLACYYYELASSNDLLLIGTHDGQVECIDLAARKSRWLYRFPASIPPWAKSRNWVGDYDTAKAMVSRQCYTDPIAATPSIVLPDGFDPITASPASLASLYAQPVSSPVVWDPAPTNPLAGLGTWYIVTSWVGAIVPLTLAAISFVLMCRHRLHITPLLWTYICLGAALLASFCFDQSAYIDWPTTLLMKLGLWIPSIAIVLIALGLMLQRRHSLPAAIPLAAILLLLLIYWPMFFAA